MTTPVNMPPRIVEISHKALPLDEELYMKLMASEKVRISLQKEIH